MLLIVVLSWILAQVGIPIGIALWGWFSTHIAITILLILIFALKKG
jgi:hypothetical protein